MKGFVWSVVGIAGLAWTGLGWALYSIAGSGGAAVVGMSRWLDLEPASTQWIADGFSMAGGIAQFLVVLVWLIGAGVLGLLAWLGGLTVSSASIAPPRFPGPDNRDKANVIDGQVHDKKVS